MPDWMTMPEWLEPKLLVLIVLVGTVLFLSRDRSGERARAKRRITSMLEHHKR
jgi:hypothetical protein